MANALWRLVLVAVLAGCVPGVEPQEPDSGSVGRSTLLDNGVSRTLRHLYAQCADSEDIFWCFKVHSTRLLGRALKVTTINVLEGVSIVKRADDVETRSGRAHDGGGGDINLSNRDLESLSMKSLDALLVDRFMHFVQSRQLQVSLPRLLTFGQRNSQDLLNSMWEMFAQFFGFGFGGEGDGGVGVGAGGGTSVEGRGKKKDDKKYLGPFIAAVLLKTAILKMAYHSIAILAGKALIVGKIALIISSIIGLKKLVSTEGGEKTTYEIVKHPQVQQSHTYSSSHSGEYESGGHESSGGGSYHRSIDDEMMMQDKAYQAWVPSHAAQ